MIERRKKSPPASIGTPRVMQKTRTGEGTNSVADSTRNDGVGPNPCGSSGPDKSRRNSRGKRSNCKHRRKTLSVGTLNVRTLLSDGKFELLINFISLLFNLSLSNIAYFIDVFFSEKIPLPSFFELKI